MHTLDFLAFAGNAASRYGSADAINGPNTEGPVAPSGSSIVLGSEFLVEAKTERYK